MWYTDWVTGLEMHCFWSSGVVTSSMLSFRLLFLVIRWISSTSLPRDQWVSMCNSPCDQFRIVPSPCSVYPSFFEIEFLFACHPPLSCFLHCAHFVGVKWTCLGQEAVETDLHHAPTAGCGYGYDLTWFDLTWPDLTWSGLTWLDLMWSDLI